MANINDQTLNHTLNLRDQPARPKVRQDIQFMSQEDLDRYRLTVEKMMKIQDDRGYGYMGTVHGGAQSGRPFGPMPVYCQHGTNNFVTWHRCYVYEFEQRLQDIDPEVTIPYWDWTSKESIAKGIPKAFLDKTYKDPVSGETKPNPLLLWKNLQGNPSSPPTNPNDWSVYPDTYRNPGKPSELSELRDLVAEALEEDQFLNFTHALENPHNLLHNWVNGTMTTYQSSYDPIFWSHHANVDRQWWQWQTKYGNSSIPDSVLSFVCQPFGTVVEKLLDIKSLGYIYGSSSLVVGRAEAKIPATAGGEEAPLPPTMFFDIGDLKYKPTTAKLNFYGLHHTVNSYEIRVYANNPKVDGRTGRNVEKGYLGSLHILGHGDCVGQLGHCDLPKGPRRPFDIRPPHHLTPYNTFINLTRHLDVITKGVTTKKKKSIELAFVVVDTDKKQVPSSVIEFDTISLNFDV